MPISDYNEDPDLNTSINGINIAEGCPPSGINNAIRQLMADLKSVLGGSAGGLVHTSGDETIGGTKTFTSTIAGSISGNAASATRWNGAAKTVSTAEASGGAAGDVHFQYIN